MPGAFESLCEALLPSAPVNTPDNGLATPYTSAHNVPKLAGSDVKSRKENIQDSPLVFADINPVGNENATRKVGLSFITESPGQTATAPVQKPTLLLASQTNPVGTGLAAAGPGPASQENPIRRVSQPFTTTHSGNKRQRVVTPAAVKAIDDEDEPGRSSPSRATSISMRKTSQASTRTAENKENERIVLGDIENV